LLKKSALQQQLEESVADKKPLARLVSLNFDIDIPAVFDS